MQFTAYWPDFDEYSIPYDLTTHFGFEMFIHMYAFEAQDRNL